MISYYLEFVSDDFQHNIQSCDTLLPIERGNPSAFNLKLKVFRLNSTKFSRSQNLAKLCKRGEKLK